MNCILTNANFIIIGSKLMHNGCGGHAQYRRFSCTTSAVSMLIRSWRIHRLASRFADTIDFAYDLGEHKSDENLRDAMTRPWMTSLEIARTAIFFE